MKHYTLTLVFNADCSQVLMCHHRKWGKLNFIGGKTQAGEDMLVGSYRELFEETGISEDQIDLHEVREEIVTGSPLLYDSSWHMYVTYGILKEDVKLRAEKNLLEWVPVTDPRILDSAGYGNCRVFLNEALLIIQKGSSL